MTHMSMDRLTVDYNTMGYGGHKHKNAWAVMKELGITFKKAIPQTLGDCVWFLECENVPDKLPEYVTEFPWADEAQKEHWSK